MAMLSEFFDTVARKTTSWRELLKTNEADVLAERLRSIPDRLASAKRIGGDSNQPEAVRVAAAGLLARDDSFRADALKILAALLVPKSSADIQRSAIRALGVSGHVEVPNVIAEVWPGLGPEMRLVALDELLGREPWALALVGLVEQGRISPNALDASRRGRLLRHGSGRVKQAAAKIFSEGGTTSRAEVVQRFRPALALAGDASRGGIVFNKLCVTCHKRGEQGNDVGPNLQSVVNHPAEKLLVSILDPNASIEPGYTAYSAQLSDGEEIYGIVSAETGNSLVMKQADGKTRTLLRSGITALRSANLSLMPEGLEAGMSPQELADLIRFLQTP
ncbi:MAG: c-type cytochrome [Verrucomicrobia bacterium]|nr:c-type cytochrome [Verrucomicrobiota bacterium]